MNRAHCITLAMFASVILMMMKTALARDQIQISGSSTVLPYAKIVAETFGEIYYSYKVPVIESGGSGAGIKEFCRGIGKNTIDIVNASRPIKRGELQACSYAGVEDIEEVRIGYDGIVFASNIDGPDLDLSTQDIYKALAARVIINGKLQVNPVRKWSEINSHMPAWNVTAYIPGEKHGTREVFEEKVMLRGCQESGEFDIMEGLGLDRRAIREACVVVRKDGKAVDVDGDYSEMFARVSSEKTGIGVFSLAFYENNADRLKVAAVDGVIPTRQTIVSGQYEISRPLFFYVKKAHFSVIPGLREYVRFFLSEQMIGPDGPLAEYGLVVATEDERKIQRASFEENR